MHVSIDQALAAAQRPTPLPEALPRILIAGATGFLGNAVLRRLVGMRRGRHTQVLATLPMHPGIRHVSAQLVPAAAHGKDDFSNWPIVQADLALVMFDPPRMFYGREKALWTPAPHQLAMLGTWLQSCGVHTLAVILPYAQGSLPQALRHGLANLDEQALAALKIERLLLLRSAQKPAPPVRRHHLHAVAAWMLGITSYMLPRTEQVVRAAKVAEFVDLAVGYLPAGSHVLSSEIVWQAAQGDSAHMRRLLRQYLAGRHPAAANSPSLAADSLPRSCNSTGRL